MKIARIRIQVDVEVDVPATYFQDREDARFFYEENHCVENETIRALDLLKEAGDVASEVDRRKHKTHGGVCVTCHGADATLLSFRDATSIEAAVAAEREAAARAEKTTEERLRLALGALRDSFGLGLDGPAKVGSEWRRRRRIAREFIELFEPKAADEAWRNFVETGTGGGEGR